MFEVCLALLFLHIWYYFLSSPELLSIEQLLQTPEGKAELERRMKVFGECKRIEDETPGPFYDKLRRWLEREIPQTRSPLHPPRQVGG